MSRTTTTTDALSVRVNPTPAQTWNKLSINDYAIDLPPVAGANTHPAEDVASIEMGAGDVALGWLDAAACGRTRVDVGAGEMQTICIDVTESGDVAATDIVLGEDARARVVVVGSTNEATSGSVLRIDAAPRASVELVGVLATGPEAQFLDAVGIRLAKDASAEVHHYVLGGGTNAVSVVVDEVGRGARYEQSTRYLVRSGETLDMSYTARMRGANSKADLAFSGILGEGAHKRLSDVIDLVRGAKGATGHEDETVLVVGDHVENLTLPSVLCSEEDVEGTHGATIGSVSPEQMEYLISRGLTEEDVHNLFVRALFDDACHHLPEATDTIVAAAERILGAATASELRDAVSVA